MSDTNIPTSATPKSGGPVDPAVIADLAAAARILAAQGVVDGMGHVSMRHPSAPNRFLMSKAQAPALVTPDDIIEYDLDCTPCNAAGRGSFLERFIHGAVYQARGDVMALVHSHSPSVIPFGLVPVPMQAMFHNAAFLAAGVPVFDIAEKFGATDMLVGNPAKGRAFTDIMGDKDVALMRAHGSVACGSSLQTAVFRAVYTEVNARIQHWTQALGGMGPMAAPMAALNREEGVLADAVNQGAALRAWDLWRGHVRAQTSW